MSAAGLSDSSLLYHNNVLSLPIMASYMLTTTSEIQTVREYPQLNNIWFLVRPFMIMMFVLSLHSMRV